LQTDSSCHLLCNSATDDKGLISSLKEGDEYAFTSIYHKYHKQLYFIAIKYVKDPDLAEDVVQDVFIKLWSYRDNLKEDLSVKGFLITSVRNLVLNTIRNKNTQIAKHIDLLHAKEVSRNDVEDTISLMEYEGMVERGISQLSPAKQQIFRLRTLDGLDNSEISTQLGISINTVKFQFSQASKFVRKYLKQNADINGLAGFIYLFF
jgi:RNA polymerase sigma-70 factor (family 1)